MSSSRRWARIGILGIGAVVLVSLGAVAFSALGSQSSGTFGTAATPQPCSPQPCLRLQNYTMWVSNINESDGIIRMQVDFRNSSSATHADPADLRLIDAQHHSFRFTQDPAGCTHWSRTEFANGARYGPVTICYRPDSLAAPLTLEWNPDMGMFCCTADLKIK
ncbi:MAG: hypothetical protein ABI401_13050 [Candidatus Dormibacter sp.]